MESIRQLQVLVSMVKTYVHDTAVNISELLETEKASTMGAVIKDITLFFRSV